MQNVQGSMWQNPTPLFSPKRQKQKIENKRKNERSQTQENATANFL